jgi:hypothetical protein
MSEYRAKGNEIEDNPIYADIDKLARSAWGSHKCIICGGMSHYL